MTTPRDLKARRQRNLTTSALICPSSFLDKQRIENIDFSSSSFADNCLDKFLDSLEDINNYLDKQLNSSSQQDVTKTQFKENTKLKFDVENSPKSSFQKARKSRRFSTQPILFGQSAREQQKQHNSEIESR